jgi:hypothetical protein
MANKNKLDEYSPEEAARRRDSVVRRMANTPPQPNWKPTVRPSGKRKPTASNRPKQKK